MMRTRAQSVTLDDPRQIQHIIAWGAVGGGAARLVGWLVWLVGWLVGELVCLFVCLFVCLVGCLFACVLFDCVCIYVLYIANTNSKA